MSHIKSGKELILEALKEKSCYKQKIFRQTIILFEQLKKRLKTVGEELSKETAGFDADLDIGYQDKGSFEAELTVAGDVLIFSMHTNVFNFDDTHFVHKTPYVKENASRSYCGMIQIHNFLSDSFKYNRLNDIGYLIARIFINYEKHFFVEGKRQLGFLYNDFDNMVMNDVYMNAIIESAILYTVDFDLLVPPYQNVKEISVMQKIQEEGNTAIKTGKRLGFKFQADSDRLLG